MKDWYGSNSVVDWITFQSHRTLSVRSNPEQDSLLSGVNPTPLAEVAAAAVSARTTKCSSAHRHSALLLYGIVRR